MRCKPPSRLAPQSLSVANLVELEYLIAHRGRNGVFEYELLYSANDDGKPHLCGLIDLTALAGDGSRSGSSDEQSGPGRAVVGERSDATERRQSRAEQGEAVDPVGPARSAVNPANGLPSLAAVVEPS
jgi:DNA primase